MNTNKLLSTSAGLISSFIAPVLFADELPESTSEDVVLSASGTYTATTDRSYKSLSATASGVNISLDQSATVTLEGRDSAGWNDAPQLWAAAEGGDFSWSGGTLTFSKAYGPIAGSKKKNANVLFKDMTINKGGFFYGGYQTSNVTCTFDNVSMSVTEFCGTFASGTGNRVVVSGGSQITASGYVRGQYPNNGGRTGFIVTGEGTKLEATGSGKGLLLDEKCTGNYFEVSDGATLYVNSIWMGRTAGCGLNWGIVTNATLTIKDTVFVGQNSGTNTLEVVDTSFSAQHFRIGDAAASCSNVFKLVCSTCSGNLCDVQVGYKGSDNIVLIDGSFVPSAVIGNDAGAKRNRLDIANDATTVVSFGSGTDNTLALTGFAPHLDVWNFNDKKKSDLTVTAGNALLLQPDPVTGFDATKPLISNVKNFTMNAGSKLLFDKESIEALRKTKSYGKWTIVTADSINVDDGVLAEAKAWLADYPEFKLMSDSQNLYLKFRPTGLILLFK